jgi:endonuclease YncB( thermonuclease family)
MSFKNSFSISILVTCLFFGVGCFSVSAGGEKRISRFFLEVVDGDTIIYRGVRMRFLGVDTPETKNPDLGFYRDQPYGREAKAFTVRELRKAGKVTYLADGYDVYGRLLVHVFVDGYPL